MRPLLVFGLRGTLLERIHAIRVPSGMPGGAITVGMSRVWLRPSAMETLLALQQHCTLAVWSSTTARNTTPLMEAVFSQHAQKVNFAFVWSREHTTADEFRRVSATSRDDQHATVKDLREVYRRFPEIATPQNTVLIDDTPSKGKLNASNFLWLETCEELKIENPNVMPALRRFVEEHLLAEREDVRRLLPARVPWGQQ
ncbi:TFIIF-stimulated CTD phosphatase [Trypanosoma brucei equiperdum]|uniref:Mitochondrial import inner membrane translocase subunit TIM50 n=1 Tax=Trypanosoma brucei equiperdum TaxID=630700 RepID=A0A3L6L8Y0_9TRYP|nr:TFIIF-stimulated CTD phosphatase [Trypanosoma brucei equiperdum]